MTFCSYADFLAFFSHNNLKESVRINNQIRAQELRVIGPAGENLGVISLLDALAKTRALGLDLIEISPNATPPIAKITDYGKFQYEKSKKHKEARAKTHTTETKTLQVKIGTGEHDLELKAKQATGWLKEGHRVKIGLYLSGRAKYMDQVFLKTRLDRILKLIAEDHKISQPIERGPKGLSLTIERVKK